MKPAFDGVIAALRFTDDRWAHTRPTPEEAEVADVLAEIAEHHGSDAQDPDGRGRYGRCTGCSEWWPCPSWAYGEELAVQWLGRGAARYCAHARAALNRIAAPNVRRVA